QFLDERDALLEGVFPESALMPGAERLVRHLAACGVPIAVATGSHRHHFQLKTSRHTEFFALFQAVVTGDMVPRAKPDPAIFVLAAASLGLAAPPAPAATLVFEDAPNGVQAALAGGMRVVLVPYPGFPDEIAAGAGATQVLKSLEGFRPEEWGLPPFAEV
ncbi:Pseudouridine-5'-monophosphatase, partial [Tetrabaena socialis]